MDIEGKVALVTGGGSGIGRATARRLSNEGASVVVVDVNDQGASETVEQIESSGGKAASTHADVSQEGDAKEMIAFAEKSFGGLDILHNNAGIITGAPRWPENDPSEWSRMLDINLRGVILGTQYAIPAMRKRGGGAIVSTASMAGIGWGYGPNPVYAAAKGGVVLFTASLAQLAMSDNIRANCVCPGVVDTPMLKGAAQAADSEDRGLTSERLRNFQILSPDEIADAVVSLIRDDSLAGRALMVRNGMEPELWRLPEMPRLPG
jgi:NAD(P)-dependent dehydrogenase (short-subunit alcohol dehydrogenase family)